MIRLRSEDEDLEYGKELFRKGIHLFTSIIAFSYFYADKKTILMISIFLMSGFLAADILRLNFRIVGKYFHLIFSELLRKGEKRNALTGATYLFIGITASIILFPKYVAITAVLILTLSDTAAAVVGRKFGRNKIGNKSVEGSAAFFAVTAAIIVCVLKPVWYVTVIAALSISILEAAPLKINDNLTIPLISGLLLTVLL
jgi:dolichol kinase